MFYILIVVLIAQSCNYGKRNSNTVMEQFNKSVKSLDTTITNTIPEVVKISESNLVDTCSCQSTKQRHKSYKRLIFSNNLNGSESFTIDSIAKWKDKPERFQVKSLLLRDFDSLPAQLQIFENVVHVWILGTGLQKIKGLHIFPNLKILEAEGITLKLNSDAKWLTNIEVIRVNKTRIAGLKSFKLLPNLKELTLSFSGFDSFPDDFSSLACLSVFEMGAYTFGEVDLAQIDLLNKPCLKKITLQSWRKNMTGIPKGIANVNSITVSHPNLTNAEKKVLDTY